MIRSTHLHHVVAALHYWAICHNNGTVHCCKHRGPSWNEITTMPARFRILPGSRSKFNSGRPCLDLGLVHIKTDVVCDRFPRTSALLWRTLEEWIVDHCVTQYNQRLDEWMNAHTRRLTITMKAVERRKHQMLFDRSKQTNAHKHDEDC